MKQLMGIGVPHVPFITGNPALGDENQVGELLKTFQQLKEKIDQFEPDVVVMISADHVNKFFLDNVPAFCVGVAKQFDGPSDKGSGLTYMKFQSDEEFAENLVIKAHEGGFDLSYTRHWTLDHGMMVPIDLLTKYNYPIVPIFVNAAMPPLPTSKRCIEVGKFIRNYIENQSHVKKVAIVGAGGISHSVGSEDMGKIDEDFDRKFLKYINEGNESKLASISFEEMDQAGSSTPEILAWMIAAGVFLPSKGTTEFYEPIKGFATGCGISTWPTIKI